VKVKVFLPICEFFLNEKILLLMGVGSGGQGGRGPSLDFHTWYKNIVERGLKVLFFGLFSVFPPPERG